MTDPADIPHTGEPAAYTKPRAAGELFGLWRRDYLRAPATPPDVSTWVAWLQGRRYYCDLRQPYTAGLASGARCLRELGETELRELAQQQGFAGELCVTDGVAHWQRRYDFQPPGPFADRASVRLSGDTLLEAGIEQDYEEQWTREPHLAAAGAHARDEISGQGAVIVLGGPWMMVLRDRRARLPAATSLVDALDGATSRAQRQDLVDCEISIGRLARAGAWHVDRSTLPYKAGRTWQVSIDLHAGGTARLEDVDPNGARVQRVFAVLDAD